MSKRQKKNNKEFKNEMVKSIPDEIKIMFGKFFVFSLLYLLFFFILYPFILIDKISKWCSIIIFILLIGFYVYMIIDVLKKRKTYISEGFILIIPLVFIAISFSIIKFII